MRDEEKQDLQPRAFILHPSAFILAFLLPTFLELPRAQSVKLTNLSRRISVHENEKANLGFRACIIGLCVRSGAGDAAARARDAAISARCSRAAGRADG